MKIRQIKIRVGKTVTFEPYQSARCEIELVGDVDEDEDARAAFESLFDKARQKLMEKIRTLIE